MGKGNEDRGREERQRVKNYIKKFGDEVRKTLKKKDPKRVGGWTNI